MFDLSSGAMRWEAAVGAKDSSIQHPGPPGLGTDIISAPGALLVLSDGSHVARLDDKTGRESWGWSFPGGG